MESISTKRLTAKQKKQLNLDGWYVLLIQFGKNAVSNEVGDLQRLAVGGNYEVIAKYDFHTAYQIGKKAIVVYRPKPETQPVPGCKTCGLPDCTGDCHPI